MGSTPGRGLALRDRGVVSATLWDTELSRDGRRGVAYRQAIGQCQPEGLGERLAVDLGPAYDTSQYEEAWEAYEKGAGDVATEVVAATPSSELTSDALTDAPTTVSEDSEPAE